MNFARSGRLIGYPSYYKVSIIGLRLDKIDQVYRNPYHSTQNPFGFSCFRPPFDLFRFLILQYTQDLQALLNLGYRPP